jgi:hypothetical protein
MIGTTLTNSSSSGTFTFTPQVTTTTFITTFQNLTVNASYNANNVTPQNITAANVVAFTVANCTGNVTLLMNSQPAAGVCGVPIYMLTLGVQATVNVVVSGYFPQQYIFYVS